MNAMINTKYMLVARNCQKETQLTTNLYVIFEMLLTSNE